MPSLLTPSLIDDFSVAAFPPICPPRSIGRRLAGFAPDIDGLRDSPFGEHNVADRRYARGDGDAGKAGTTHERPIADRRYACGNGYAGKAVAIVERADADRRNAYGDGYIAACRRIGHKYGFMLVVQYAAFACVVGIVSVYRYGGKAVAIGERLAGDRRYACGNGYTGKAGAIVERGTTDSRYAFGDGYITACRRIGHKYGFILVVQYAVFACVMGIFTVYGYFGKAGTPDERAVADRRYSFGDGDAGKAGAIGERLEADNRYACGDGYTSEANTTQKHLVVDSRYA